MIRIIRRNEAKRAAGPVAGSLVKRFDTGMDLAEEGRKKFTEVKDGDRTVDYRDVKISGYLSTFGNTDRDGDVVEPGAFDESIKRFKTNPVLLIDHNWSADAIAGSFTKVKEDETGLYVEAVLSNSASERMKDIRAKVAEGHIRTLSMGGLFHYDETGRKIFRVDLYEGSLVAVPANPKATFSVRTLTEAEQKQLQKGVMPGVKPPE